MTASPDDTLDRARIEVGLSHGELWMRYFEIGGMSTAFELEAILIGVMQADPYNHDVIVHALNERFSELGGDHPLPYLADEKEAE